MGIWPFNPDAISSDRLEPSLATEQFDIVPTNSQPLTNQPSTNQPSTNKQPSVQLVKSSQPLSNKLNHRPFTRSNVALLEKEKELLENENEMLKQKNEILKTQFAAVKEELETYKNPGTCSLRSALKYPVL